jgi:hypothetical protein
VGSQRTRSKAGRAVLEVVCNTVQPIRMRRTGPTDPFPSEGLDVPGRVQTVGRLQSGNDAAVEPVGEPVAPLSQCGRVV